MLPAGFDLFTVLEGICGSLFPLHKKYVVVIHELVCF